MDAAIRKERRYIKAKMSRIEAFIKTIVPGAEIKLQEISVRLERLELVNNEFTDVHKRLLLAVDGQDLPDADENEEIEFEERYISCKVRMSDLLRQARVTPMSTSVEQQQQQLDEPTTSQSNVNNEQLSRVLEQQVEILRQLSNNTPGSNREIIREANPRESQVKLPIIKLPTFDGESENWQRFSDTFQTLIHNNNELSDIQKYQYLSTTLQGTAAKVIEAIEISSDNYLIAWELLKNRFEDTVSIKKRHIQALFEMPKVERESVRAIQELMDHTLKHLRILKSMSLSTEYWDELIIHLMESNLDVITRRAWEQDLDKRDNSTLKDMTTFLQKRCQMLERINSSLNREVSSNKFNAKQGNRTTVVEMSKTRGNKTNSFATIANQGKCFLCQGHHFIYQCTKFLAMSVDDRIKEVRRLRLCHNCLRNDHFAKTCKFGVCRECSERHNTLCHKSKNIDGPSATSNTITESSQSLETNHNATSQVNAMVHHSLPTRKQRILLSTAVINAVHANGSLIPCRVLLDSASEANFITAAACNKLGITTNEICESLLGLNEMTSQVKEACVVNIKSRMSEFQASIDCLVVRRVSYDLPSFQIDVNRLQIPATIKLADPQFYVTSKVDMLIGAEMFYKLLKPQQINLHNDQPTIQNTTFGWVVSGPIPRAITSFATTQGSLSVLKCSIKQRENLIYNLNKFWELEECNVRESKILSKEEKQSEEFFSKTITRDESGRFIVRLPFRDNKNQLGDSREIALKRFNSLEQRLKTNTEMYTKYSEFMQEYVNLRHMSLVSNTDQESKPIIYLPHHGVLKESSTTTKLRVVFDASAKTNTGVSLNETLLTGPTIQDELFDIIIRFRIPRVVITADIQKMYRQILVHPDDRDCQRILWRFSQEDCIQDYRLNTVTYGQSCAPFLAIRCVRQLATERKNEYPLASKALLQDLYVDDLLTGVDNIDEAKVLQKQLQLLLDAGGFILHKWSSNYAEVLSDVPKQMQETHSNVNINEDNTIKTLGLEWQPTIDSFRFSIQLSNLARTKREILSGIAKLFDPLGLISPITIRAKLLMQQTWTLNVDWDELLPEEIREEWRRYISDLEQIRTLRIPRRVVMSRNSSNLNLLGFCDASERAYGACVYVQTKSSKGNKEAVLLCSKSKVAPVKKTTIPRLELCGALLLARLIQRMKQAIPIAFRRIDVWTDSTVVLAWINGDAARWKPFVSNRVTEIQSILSSDQWHHIPGDQNPADIISRGITYEKFKDYVLWWNGPNTEILEKYMINTPKEQSSNQDPATMELKSTILVHSVQDVEHTIIKDMSERISSLYKIERIIAYILRFKSNCTKPHSQRALSSLTFSELQAARRLIIKRIQAEHFQESIRELQREPQLRSCNKLLSLNPFVDEVGLLRVGGRLQLSTLNFRQKHPILLPADNWFTKRLFEQTHKRLLHAGPQSLLANIRLYYWPLRGRDLARATVHKCITCFKSRPRKLEQIMGSLPKERVVPTRPFFITGIDFAGPITTLVNKGRGRKTNKSYVALFVCFSTKAIHLEVTSELTADAFMATLRRFIGRRGCPQQIFSDNATNFTKAHRDIKELYSFLKKEVEGSLQDALIQHGIQWRFIPPGSPHMGGLWEAGVKSCKFHMRRMMQNTLLTFEELSTLLVQIEACLNSRPLCQLSTDPSDLQPLTPGHFLVGEPITSLPEADFTEIKMNRLTRWQLIQRTVQDFWKRWSLEYLTSMQGRVKWNQIKEDLSINDLVMIQEENNPPLKWKIGRVIEVYRGNDKRVRVATVRTATGILKRSISKLCKLPIHDQN